MSYRKLPLNGLLMGDTGITPDDSANR